MSSLLTQLFPTPASAPASVSAPISSAALPGIEGRFDGSAMPNPGKMGFSWILGSMSGAEKWAGKTGSNNMAEYFGFISLLDAISLNVTPPASITIHGDSLLIINQVNGTWKVKDQKLAILHALATKILEILRSRGITIMIEQQPRSFNAQADSLAKNAPDGTRIVEIIKKWEST